MQSFEECVGNIKGKNTFKLFQTQRKYFFRNKYSTELLSNGLSTNVKQKRFQNLSQEAIHVQWKQRIVPYQTLGSCPNQIYLLVVVAGLQSRIPSDSSGCMWHQIQADLQISASGFQETFSRLVAVGIWHQIKVGQYQRLFFQPRNFSHQLHLLYLCHRPL